MYTTQGNVRGNCGHKHQTMLGAVQCCQRDRDACGKRAGGSYSDREVVRCDGEPLTPAELSAMDAAFEQVVGF